MPREIRFVDRDVFEGGDLVALDLRHADPPSGTDSDAEEFASPGCVSRAPPCAMVPAGVLFLVAAFGGGAGGGPKACAMRNGWFIWATICRTNSQFAAWLGLTAIRCPRIGRPSSDRSPTMSSILCRTNSSGYRSGSVVSTASSRMTTAFSRLPPLMRPFLMRYSISS